MIRVTIEVDEHGHDFRIARETNRYIADGSASDTVDKLLDETRSAMHAALNTAPTRKYRT